MKRAVVLLPLLLSACASPPLRGVHTFQNASSHITGKVTYPQTPPAGGAHNPVWQNCGSYAQPLYDEYAVHSLEHGAVWITYRPDLAPQQLRQLQQLVDGRPYLLLSPYPNLRVAVVVSAWNAQLDLSSPSDPQLLPFIQTYAQGGSAPEIGAPCSGAYGEPA
ncbi:DUF3105 domain-containing protein [Deinococcus ruber]|uniref:DUF3105 domain-containing protein n=1 Tax=Deinococcus ruber TaxID=1848197 RepID=A0A918FB85_9DEIO|nr:DUF3105 domain-containing protein [Deinococcus ruber]GGR27184.1 hypothetical protein GCM10008957_43180 [Deinococcus ruber]